jgi:peptidoglycan/LPS O-acetylase OafA/YrhL
MRYSVYVVRRFFRIVAPLAIALLFSAGLYFSIQPVRLPGLSDWANDMIWNQPVTAVAFFRHVFMFGLSGDTFMDSVIWSLVYEMRISLLFPVLYFLCRKSPLTVTGVACVVCVLMQAVMKSHHMALYVGEGLWQSLVLTLYYVPFFLLGICVYHYRMWIKQTVSKLNRWQITVFSLLVLALALDKHDVLIALSGVGPMALAWSRAGVCQFLSHKLFVFMGRISYSLYLVHMLVMASLMQTLYGRASPLFMALAMLMLSPLVAYIFYVCVERPFLTLGRQCSVFVEQQCERVTS